MSHNVICETGSPRSTALHLRRTAFIRKPLSHRQHSAVAVGIYSKGRKRLKCFNDVNWDAFGHPPPTPCYRISRPVVRQYDFAVVGSGIAGLTYALKVADYGNVAILTKKRGRDGCTQYAQGGVCAVLDAADSVDDHIRDTLIAGSHLNDRQCVDVVCREAPARVLELVHLGANFTRRSDGSLHLTREGGHSGRRIVHAADATGKEIESTLLRAIRSHPNIDMYENHVVVDLVVEDVVGMPHCLGVDVLDEDEHQMCRFIALTTMLSSGGAGQVYPNTTNPIVATGDGIALAHRAKARIANMEFVQFHPTSLYTEEKTERAVLISEAVRGEGGRLLNLKGERFMANYDPRMELAPRDVVSRAIHDQVVKHSASYVLLDISHKPKPFILSHFPNIALACAQHGIDMTSEPIPVIPAQHYLCGGVQSGLLGETSIQGLYACGEVACTGLHGANRLASNSLLEALVFAHRAAEPSIAHAEHAQKHCGREIHYAAASAEHSWTPELHPLSSVNSKWIEKKKSILQKLMWEHCGIVRSQRGLLKALPAIASLYLETKAFIKSQGISSAAIELLNMITVGELIVFSAAQRKESRGLHYVTDFPEARQTEKKPTVIEGSLRKRHGLRKNATTTQMSHCREYPNTSSPSITASCENSFKL